jgi:hypothetical protein
MDKNLVAAVLKAEAGGEGDKGQIAVLSVIWTRAMRSPFWNWPSTLDGVVTQPHQFSCLNKNDPTYPQIQEWIKDPKSHLFPQLSIIEAWLAGHSPNPVAGADHYLNPKTADPATVKKFDKELKLVCNLGNHRFYEAFNPKSIGAIARCYYNPVNILSLTNSHHVRLIQSQLNNVMGLNLDVDGAPGDKTRNAWIEFKKANHQEFVDLVGEGSLKLLDRGVKTIVKPDDAAPETLAEKIVAVCDKRKFPLDRKGGLNIIGLEGVNPDGSFNNDTPDQWNDLMVLLKFAGGKPTIVWQCQSTTEPGRYYTDRPLNSAGCARLDTGYHKAIWSRGQHKGHSAMVQTGTARLVRDGNRNHSRDDKVTQEQWKGINWHSAYGNYSGGSIGQWSAGCCVSIPVAKFNQAMQLIDQSGKKQNYDFILIWRDWLKEV